jgi:hypothetical protein
MSSNQYTIRSVPDHVDRELRRRAKQEQRSLNAVVLDALQRALDLQARPRQYTDLDFLVGCWEEDQAFAEAVAQFDQVDQEMWQ